MRGHPGAGTGVAVHHPHRQERPQALRGDLLLHLPRARPSLLCCFLHVPIATSLDAASPFRETECSCTSLMRPINICSCQALMSLLADHAVTSESRPRLGAAGLLFHGRRLPAGCKRLLHDHGARGRCHQRERAPRGHCRGRSRAHQPRRLHRGRRRRVRCRMACHSRCRSRYMLEVMCALACMQHVCCAVRYRGSLDVNEQLLLLTVSFCRPSQKVDSSVLDLGMRMTSRARASTRT